jgi:hypothetical protein
MTRAVHRPLCEALVAVVLLAPSVLAQPVGVPAVVDRLLQGFAAPDCPSRWKTIEEYMDRMIGRVRSYEESGPEITALLRERASSAGAAMEQRVQMVSAFVDDAENAIVQLAKAQEAAVQSGSGREIWRKALPSLTKVLDDPRETFLTRRLASSVIAQSARKSSQARDAGWDQPVPRLLASKDPTARLLGSIAAASGSLLPQQAPSRGQVIPELIRGLDAASFPERYESTRALLQAAGQPIDRFCVDPSDSAGERASSIQAWQAWWDQNKARIGGETIPQ